MGTDQEISNGARVAVLQGLLGNEVAAHYADYSCPVKPREVLTHGVKKLEDKILKLERKEIIGLAYGIVSYAKSKVNDDEKIGETCADFAELMVMKRKGGKDVALAFVRMMVDKDDINQKSRNARMAVLSNPNMEALLGSFMKKTAGGKKDFLTRLMERENLKKPLQNVAWATTSTPDPSCWGCDPQGHTRALGVAFYLGKWLNQAMLARIGQVCNSI